MIRLGAGALLLMLATPVTPVHAIQPCAILAIPAEVFAGGRCADRAVLEQFFRSGHDHGIDPRVAMAIAAYESDRCNGNDFCTSQYNDPFSGGPGPLGTCHQYATLNAAVDEVTNTLGWALSHSSGSLSSVITLGGPYLDTGGRISYWFHYMSGDPNQPVVYWSACCGDCNHSQSIDINELIYLVQTIVSPDWLFVCNAPVDCVTADTEHNFQLDLFDMIRMVDEAVDGCPSP